MPIAWQQSMWEDIAESTCYSPYEPKVVIALVASDESIAVPSPYQTEAGHRGRIVAPLSEVGPSLPCLTEMADEVSLPGDALFLLCPTARSEVESVAGNWSGLLKGETWAKWADGTHGWFIASEVADDWNTFPNFLGAEVALWESIHRLLPSKASDLGLKAAQDARDLGDIILEWMVGRGKGRPPVALNGLCDIARRTMVFEKRHWLQTLLSETGQAESDDDL